MVFIVVIEDLHFDLHIGVLTLGRSLDYLLT